MIFVNDIGRRIQSLLIFLRFWIEQHAYEFAGRLLVPREKLIEKLNNAVAIARKAGFDAWDPATLHGNFWLMGLPEILQYPTRL